MGDRKQPTPIDADEYEKFVQFVKEVHGGTRGHLRTEVENALREYRESYYGGSDRLQRIEDQVASIHAKMADQEADGSGAVVPPTDPSGGEVRAPASSDDDADNSPMEKPAPNQPRGQKVEWLVQKAREKYQGTTTVDDLREDVVDEHYGFSDEVTDDYVEAILDRLGAEPDPRKPDNLRSWGDALEAAHEANQSDLEDEASDTFDQMDDAEVER